MATPKIQMNMLEAARRYARELIEEKMDKIQEDIYNGTGLHNGDDIRALRRTLEILDL